MSIYEAYWADLIPDFSNESPWQRFLRGWQLVAYWAFGGLQRAIRRSELPGRVMIGLTGAAICLLFWYLIVVALLVTATAQGEVAFPAWMADVPLLASLTTFLNGFAEKASGWPVVLFLLGLSSLGRIERVANLSAFTKAYLQNSSFNNESSSLRALTKKRLVSVLDHVHAASGEHTEPPLVCRRPRSKDTGSWESRRTEHVIQRNCAPERCVWFWITRQN
ncbi:MAG: hypothetical protein AAGI09_15040, partial [Pseudomonadota bacterium]